MRPWPHRWKRMRSWPRPSHSGDLIKMPSGMRFGSASSKISCDRGSDVFHPAAYRLIGNHDPAFSQQVLDIAEAEGEPGIGPDGLLDDHRWEAITSVPDLGHDGHLRPQITPRQAQQRDKAFSSDQMATRLQ